jgi:gluconolactonase
VCVATLGQGGITCVAPDGSAVEHLTLPDPIVTNICFGGEDGRTAFITSSGRGELLSTRWSRPGLALAFA